MDSLAIGHQGGACISIKTRQDEPSQDKTRAATSIMRVRRSMQAGGIQAGRWKAACRIRGYTACMRCLADSSSWLASW